MKHISMLEASLCLIAGLALGAAVISCVDAIIK